TKKSRSRLSLLPGRSSIRSTAVVLPALDAGAGASQTLNDPSPLTMATLRPSGLQATSDIKSVGPSSIATTFPVEASHILALLSLLAVTIERPSGLQAALSSVSVWP